MRCGDDIQRQLERLEVRLGTLTGQAVRVIANRNKQTLVHYRMIAGHGLEVRLNRALIAAPAPIIASLADWILRRGDRGAALDRYLEMSREKIRAQIRTPRIRTRGAVYDLEVVRQEILEHYFLPAGAPAGDARPPRPQCRVTWGNRRPRRRTRARRTRSIRFGSYDPILQLVRLHPRLDEPDIPRRFLAFILYHELLHAALPAVRDRAGRLQHHSAAFRRYERSHPDYAWAQRWERDNLPRLIAP